MAIQTTFYGNLSIYTIFLRFPPPKGTPREVYILTQYSTYIRQFLSQCLHMICSRYTRSSILRAYLIGMYDGLKMISYTKTWSNQPKTKQLFSIQVPILIYRYIDHKLFLDIIDLFEFHYQNRNHIYNPKYVTLERGDFSIY